MKPCTLWYRLVRQKDGTDAFEFNHLEDGIAPGDKPTPKHESHQSWARSTWRKEVAALTDDNKVVDNYDTWKPSRELA